MCAGNAHDHACTDCVVDGRYLHFAGINSDVLSICLAQDELAVNVVSVRGEHTGHNNMLANSLIEVHDTDISRTRNKNIAGENGNRSHPGTYRLFLMINMENLLEERKRRNRCQHTHGIGQGVANCGDTLGSI